MFVSLRILCVFLLLGVPGALLCIPWSLVRGNIHFMYAWAMVTMRFGLWVGGVRVRVKGRERFPHGEAVVICANHQSNLDPPVLLPLIPGYPSVFLKAELMRIPLLGRAMRMGQYVPVARGHSREEARASVDAAAKVLRGGSSIFIFPEGTRSPDGRLLPFRKGAFFLAMQTGARIVPMVVRGTAALMPRSTLKAKSGTVEVEILEPVQPREGESPEELMRRVRDVMEKALVSG